MGVSYTILLGMGIRMGQVDESPPGCWLPRSHGTERYTPGDAFDERVYPFSAEASRPLWFIVHQANDYPNRRYADPK